MIIIIIFIVFSKLNLNDICINTLYKVNKELFLG